MGNRDDKRKGIPLLVKAVAVIVISLLLVPLVIFTALPNMFFGYGSSETEAITHMTEQAMTIGGVYTSLEDFDGTQVDSIVTSIASEYEENGTTIDKIEVTSDFEEEDLLWLIAINSVAHQQDLDAMSGEDVRSFCTAHLVLTPFLDFLTGDPAHSVSVPRLCSAGADAEDYRHPDGTGARGRIRPYWNQRR